MKKIAWNSLMVFVGFATVKLFGPAGLILVLAVWWGVGLSIALQHKAEKDDSE